MGMVDSCFIVPVGLVSVLLQGQQHSAQIFCLAVLLSSIFMYNQIGAIDAIAIERLAMVCELTMRMKAKTVPGDYGITA